jgi:hypothetical protein
MLVGRSTDGRWEVRESLCPVIAAWGLCDEAAADLGYVDCLWRLAGDDAAYVRGR